MRNADRLPFAVEMFDDVRIAMDDGVELAARIWRPVGRGVPPVPAILEFLPYRRRDGTAERDALMHPYFAGHGYAAVRVDMRGSGDSDGVLTGEYLKREQDDGLAILAWLERRPWCTGHVGMIGISWGGFNGLQVAAHRPPQLKAVISICSTDDRYADDIHFMGGSLLLDKLTWGSAMFSLNTTPPDPEVVGPAWRELWMKRLDQSGLWIADWLSHQRRDDFWKHGSVCEDYDAIACPIYAVGGWADGYSNAVFRLLSRLKGPRKGLVGPWAHKYPHFAKPGPPIGFLQECLRWWDKWLKGIETGIMDEPLLRVWLEDPVRPAPYNEMKPGRWVAEGQWPPEGQTFRAFPLSRGRLGHAGDDVLTVASPQTTGLAAGKWCPYGVWADQPLDQRQEMAGQLVFDSDVLMEDFEVLGAPLASLTVASDRPNAMIAVTLSEVFPDGAATQVSYGLLNLTHRDSHAEPRPLAPGKAYRIALKLNELGHRFGRGNRVRLAISNAYWPIAWPSPEPNIVSVDCAASTLSLPERRASGLDGVLKPFAEREAAPPLQQTQLEKGRNTWTVHDDVMTGETVLQRINDDGWHRIDGIGLELGVRAEHRYTIRAGDPLSARLDTHYVRRYARGDWSVTCVTDVSLTADRSHFILEAKLAARDGEHPVKQQNWSHRIRRDQV
ncbi:MAG: CocE/NonD family hydrolase [Rhizobiales bacterium]|nr:CocE/NonD family hydrolase [Hyphomicrobiales bacterium]